MNGVPLLNPVPDAPTAAATPVSATPLGVYWHVPFCAARCGYCDFNTYTAQELGPGVPAGATAAGYVEAALAELSLASTSLREMGDRRPVDTVFVGGGTPTLLPSSDLVRMLAAVDDRLGLAENAEVTTEANPDSVTRESLAELAAGGFTRVSFGMQSAVPSVLSILDRTHDPDRIPRVVEWAREAGLQVSLDLIYGTPGESDDDWRTSLAAALACAPDHISAYALGIEEGTRMGAQVRRGILPPTDPDVQARRYEIADDALGSAGFAWYEVSNWAREDEGERRCRHNLGYWRGGDWWGIGPGAHSHLAGRRWWNVKHPARYAGMVADGRIPEEGFEELSADERETERVMLGIRLREGMRSNEFDENVVRGLVEDGLGFVERDRLVLTRRGRLLADPVTRALLEW